MTQFPLVLSWERTVHKIQGLSFKEAVVSFELEGQKSFNQVALLRAGIKKYKNMRLVGKSH